MYKILFISIFLTVLAIAYLAYKGNVSRAGNPPGMAAAKLQPCPKKPNCVCSEFPAQEAHYVKPLALADLSAAETMQRLARIVSDLGGQIEQSDKSYIAATFRTPLFGFVDDVEFRADHAAELVQVRSASRAGYSDLGANRKRVETIRRELSRK